MVLPWQAWVKKRGHREKICLSSKEKFPVAAVVKEGYAWQFFGTWQDSPLLIYLKKYNCNQFFLSLTP